MHSAYSLPARSEDHTRHDEPYVLESYSLSGLSFCESMSESMRSSFSHRSPETVSEYEFVNGPLLDSIMVTATPDEPLNSKMVNPQKPPVVLSSETRKFRSLWQKRRFEQGLPLSNAPMTRKQRQAFSAASSHK